MDEKLLRDAALDYHRTPTPGKISVTPTKGLINQRDLSLAYSPGVAYPCLAIEDDPAMAAEYTSRGNLVGVVTNGTAVLGLGDIGPLAAKPVMEGKACLFKKFADIDVFDLEVAEKDVDRFCDMLAVEVEDDHRRVAEVGGGHEGDGPELLAVLLGEIPLHLPGVDCGWQCALTRVNHTRHVTRILR